MKLLNKIKARIRLRLIRMLFSVDENTRAQIYENLLEMARERAYSGFRKKYSIAPDFRFNGDKILFYGNGEIECGSNSYVSEYSMFQSYQGCKIQIGSGCNISSNVRIFTQTNDADADFSVPARLIKTANVIIGDYVWIGANVVINPGVKIGRNAVVGANSVVTKDIPENAIYGGVPAKLIRMKKSKY